VKVTIIYDNEAKLPGLKADWRFSCLIESRDAPKTLFDTGASGAILLHNMRELGLDPSAIDIVVISHPHADHTGGLRDKNSWSDGRRNLSTTGRGTTRFTRKALRGVS